MKSQSKMIGQDSTKFAHQSWKKDRKRVARKKIRQAGKKEATS